MTNSRASHRLSRRRFVALGGAALAATPVTSVIWADHGGAASAAKPGAANPAAANPAAAKPVAKAKIVSLFLRGGMDGLSAIPPLAEANYVAARPGIAIPAAAALPLDARFGLHPALASLLDLYQQKQLAIVHAVGNGIDSRSHFEVQARWEAGGAVDGRGWLARALAETAPSGGGPVRAVALSANSPVSLAGCAECVASATVDGFRLGGRSGLLAGRDAALAALYADETGIGQQGRVALAALDAIGNLATGQLADVADEGVASPLITAFADAARLFRADIGIDAVTVDYGGWDTHAAMGTVADGTVKALLGELGTALSGFWSQLRSQGTDDVIVVVQSEFGRRLAENGSGGTDHGKGNVMFVLGNGLKGGQVHSDWPTLATDQLDDGDMRGTIDYRNVLSELLVGRVGLADSGPVFPGWKAKPVGLV